MSTMAVPQLNLEPQCVEDVQAIVAGMREYFVKGATRDVDFRIRKLGQLKTYLQNHEAEIFAALKADLGKGEFESYATELGLVYDEITTMTKHAAQWAKPRHVRTPLAHFPSRSTVYAQPLGVALIMSPWNYPVQLALVPLVDAIATGNCVALKPSRTSAATSAFLKKMCDTLFGPEFVFCFPGSSEMNDWLLATKFDKMFFTGSPRIGRLVMKAAAENLTRVTLELGGKSPCIVDASANVTRAAQRIAWGKCINSGQTCVAPDYFLVHKDVVEEFVAQLDEKLHEYYGQDILQNDEYPHMVSKHHFERVCGLIDNHGPDAYVAFGGQRDAESLKIAPTCLRNVALSDPVMGEEIFGPVIPVMTYETLDQAFEIVRTFAHPLACYVFADDAHVQQRVMTELSFGGGCVNDVVVHLANNHMGFGGFGESGMGSYHGKAGFDCFTHYKSTLKKGNWLELPVRVPPAQPWKDRIVRMLMK